MKEAQTIAAVTPSAPVREPYGGYHRRIVPAEDAELTHTGPGTPCGEFMRRFWQPVVLSEELKDLPVPLNVLGEELVAFRDLAGRIGVLHRHCAIAARRWNSARSRSAAYAVAITAGCSTWMAPSSTRRASRRRAGSRTRRAKALTPPSRRPGSSLC